MRQPSQVLCSKLLQLLLKLFPTSCPTSNELCLLQQTKLLGTKNFLIAHSMEDKALENVCEGNELSMLVRSVVVLHMSPIY